jgi:uncharacterized FAD-dependent dehydrogenase
MKRLAEIRLRFDHPPEALEQAVRARGVPEGTAWRILRKSLDARHKGRICWVYSVGVPSPEDEPPPRVRRRAPDPRPVVVGAGPAGLLAAYRLALDGVPPLLLEQGDAMPQRVVRMARFMRSGVLDERSNLGFGAGGAGAYSDGKLMTRVRSPHIPFVLETLVRCGAPEEIAYLASPHLGSGRIRRVIQRLIDHLVALGVEVRFRQHVASLGIRGSRATGVVLEDGTEVAASAVLLGTGHSARPVYRELERLGVAMRLKPFAVGARLEHPRALIDRMQHGRSAGHPALGAAAYRLAETWSLPGRDGRRALYSFCMCPGGYVLNAATESDGVVSNGMSNAGHRGRFSNAAMVVTVDEQDLPGDGVLRGLAWQRELEVAAAALANPGGGCHALPAQRLVDLLEGRPSSSLPPSSCPHPLRPAPLDELLPGFVVEAMARGLEVFERRMRGLICNEALLVGVETRTSAPVQVLRDPVSRESISVAGLYPIGEGAGHAGGITSSAADGVAAADALLATLPPA